MYCLLKQNNNNNNKNTHYLKHRKKTAVKSTLQRSSSLQPWANDARMEACGHLEVKAVLQHNTGIMKSAVPAKGEGSSAE